MSEVNVPRRGSIRRLLPAGCLVRKEAACSLQPIRPVIVARLFLRRYQPLHRGLDEWSICFQSRVVAQFG